MVALNENMPQCQECARRKQAAAKPFARPCLGGETDALPVGRCSPARRGKLLIAGRIADAYVNSTIFTGPGTDVALRQEPKSRGQPGRASGRRAVPREFTDDDVQSSYGANEIIYCDYPDHSIVIMVIGTGLYDPETEVYYVRNRGYNPALGRWIQRDPLQYINGANTYQFVMSNPVNGTDPLGLWHWYEPWTWPIWHSTPAKVAVDTAKHVPPGGEFCEGVEALGKLAHVGVFVHARLRYDEYNGINPLTDPLYEALSNINSGRSLTTLPPAEQEAVHDWVKRAGY